MRSLGSRGTQEHIIYCILIAIGVWTRFPFTGGGGHAGGGTGQGLKVLLLPRLAAPGPGVLRTSLRAVSKKKTPAVSNSFIGSVMLIESGMPVFTPKGLRVSPAVELN